MRSPAEMATIQIELTSACVLKCSNCTRFCGTHRVPFFMEFDLFKKAIDSLVGYALQPHAVVGFMGGEPLLHPQFTEFCEYAASKIPRDHLGLWSTFPNAPKYKAYREIICKTFGVILLNDHSRDDIKHAPVLMAAEDYFRKPCPRCNGTKLVPKWDDDPDGVKRSCLNCTDGTVTDDAELFLATENCWVQSSWSASINPKSAWFCEVAAALSDLFDGPEGWPVEPGWWKRTSMDFKEQRDWACRKCGAALPIKRERNSQDPKDDVSPSNFVRLEAIKSKKIARGEVAKHDTFEFDQALVGATYPAQTYKDEAYRRGIAARYGIGLKLNKAGYWDPHLLTPEEQNRKSLFRILEESVA